MGFTENFKKFRQRVINMGDSILEMTEEATKNALIMPFFSLLGYDVFNPLEFVPEYTCDVGTKKGEKIDYAIVRDNEPIMLIEAKRCGMKLQKQQQSQLFRYFSVNRSRIAILTNGIQYNIYSDINAPNVMDDDPFLSFNIIEDDESVFLQSLERFTSDNFDVKEILSKAVYMKYAAVVEKTFTKDLEKPSDELVKYFLSRPEIKTGSRITSHIINQYREVTAQTLRKVMGVTLTNVIVSKSPDTDADDNQSSVNASEQLAELPEKCKLVKNELSSIPGIELNKFEYISANGVHQMIYDGKFKICISEAKKDRYVIWFINPSKIRFIYGIDDLKLRISEILITM